MSAPRSGGKGAHGGGKGAGAGSAKGARAKGSAKSARGEAKGKVGGAGAATGGAGAATARGKGGHVVFLRAANVGGNNVFRPAQLAAALAHLGVVNIGAAGTFVVRAAASAEEVRAAILARLPFSPELSVRPAHEIVELVDSRPFAGEVLSKDRRGWAAALVGPVRVSPRLPLRSPDSDAWWVRFDRVQGAFALGLWQRQPGNLLFPNQVVEKALGVPATTRFWETLEKIAKLL